jgi:hypothetical protein
VIGDGYGAFALLAKAFLPDASFILVDLGKTLTMQAFGLEKAFPEEGHTLVEGEGDLQKDGFVYCRAEQADFLRAATVDTAVNIASMQEMDPGVVANYFSILRECLTGNAFFYCCNRMEKQMPDGTWSRFNDYPWDEEDAVLVDEPCPWHRYFLTPDPKGRVRIFGHRLPRKVTYDGVHWHRLARMSPIYTLRP